MGTKKSKKQKTDVLSKRPDDPAQEEFTCGACGWEKTLEFDEAEIAALRGNIRSYTGPCPACRAYTLIATDDFVAAASHREQVENMTREIETLVRKVEAAQAERDAAQKESTRLVGELNKSADRERTMVSDRDAIRRENSRLKRVVKGLRDAFLAATEEDAPQASPFSPSR